VEDAPVSGALRATCAEVPAASRDQERKKASAGRPSAGAKPCGTKSPPHTEGLHADAAFWSLWHKHADYLRGLSVRLMAGNHADAEDMLSEAMCKAGQNYPLRSEDIRNERAWLARILRNRCLDLYRRRKGRPYSESDGDSPVLERATASLTCQGEGAMTPEERVLSAELAKVIDAFLDDLPEHLRGPLLDRLMHERSYAEIAQGHRLTQANARKRVQHARAFLRKRLSDYLDRGASPGAP